MDFITQIQNLMTTAGGWIAGLATAVGGTMVGYHAIMRNLNDDPHMVAHHSNSIKKVLVGTAIALAGGGIVSYLGTVFK